MSGAHTRSGRATESNLLLIHGALGSASQLAGLKQTLDAAHTVHVVELKGHSNTPAIDAEFSIGAFVANVREFIIARSIGQTAIFGCSMGGYIALKVAAESPEIVTSVVTLGTKMHWTPDIAKLETSRLNPSRIRVGAIQFTAEPARDVGAPAYFIDPGLYVLTGNRILAVSLGGPKGVEIAKTALARMS